MALDQRTQAEALVQLAREQEPSIRGHCGSSELDAELRIEREANRARCRVTHWVVPSASARSPREPRFLRASSDYDPAKRRALIRISAHSWIARLGRHVCDPGRTNPGLAAPTRSPATGLPEGCPTCPATLGRCR